MSTLPPAVQTDTELYCRWGKDGVCGLADDSQIQIYACIHLCKSTGYIEPVHSVHSNDVNAMELAICRCYLGMPFNGTQYFLLPVSCHSHADKQLV